MIHVFPDPLKCPDVTYLTATRMVGQLPAPYESRLTARDYLAFAAADFNENSERGFVNALGNVKRSLHLSIDCLLHQYGLFALNKKESFPAKLELLDAAGLLSVSILRTLNVERNVMEHEYEVPSRARVSEAIDVAKLLLLATEKYFERTPLETVVGWASPRGHHVLRLEPYTGELQLFRLVKGGGRFKKINGHTCFVGRLRKFSDGKLDSAFVVARTPWKSVSLRRANAGDWSQLMRELVNVRLANDAPETHVDYDTGMVTLPVSVPLGKINSKALFEWLDSSTTLRPADERKNSGGDVAPAADDAQSESVAK